MPQPSQAEKNTFGDDVKLHPVTLMPLEQGHGALPADQQAMFHIRQVEAKDGEAAADVMRKKMGIPTRADHEAAAAAAKAKAEEEAKKAADVSALHERIAELEHQVADLTKTKD
jgi:hypothetical protein